MNIINEGILLNHIAKKSVAKISDNMLTVLQYRMNNEKDPKKKKEYKDRFNNLQMAVYDENGDARDWKDMSDNIASLCKDDESLRGEIDNAKNLADDIKSKDKDGFWKADGDRQDRAASNLDSDEYKSKLKDYDSKQKERHEVAEKIRKGENTKEEPKEEPKEETVKDKDGVEWIKRKKERGDGFTYCRKDDRSVTMSQKEYAKKNAQKNESLGKSLKDFINEKLN